MKRIFPFCLLSLLLLCSCTAEINKQASNMKADLDAKAKSAYDTADKTVKQVEKKVQQGKEAVDAVNTASEKIKAFQGN